MRPNILFVDDELDLLESLKDALRKKRYSIHLATTAGRALELLNLYDMDVIVSDERMPGLEGSELLTQVRVRFPNVLRILLTGQASTEARVRAINEGQIYKLLNKPIDAKVLGDVLDAAVDLSRHRRAAANPDDPNALEKAFPGITEVTRDEDGAILVTWDLSGGHPRP